VHSSELTRRISELEEQVRVLSAEKRTLEEKIQELEHPRKYVANLSDLYWVEVSR
jgi:cell division protein FtsB